MVSFGTYEVRPLVMRSNLFGEPLEVNPQDGQAYIWSQRELYQLAYDPVTGESETTLNAIQKVTTALKNLGARKIVVKGNRAECVLLSRLLGLVGW